jgi:hypothetical protein
MSVSGNRGAISFDTFYRWWSNNIGKSLKQTGRK